MTATRAAPIAHADTINLPSDDARIQDVIDASSDGDIIQSAAGTFEETDVNPNG